jgi:hypothetical protein
LRVKFASVTYFPPTERERGQQPGQEGQERGLRQERRKGLDEGRKLGGSRCGSVMRLRDDVGITNCEGCSTYSQVELPPPWFELQIFRLPGKGGYSTRPSGTTSSLVIWVES